MTGGALGLSGAPLSAYDTPMSTPTVSDLLRETAALADHPELVGVAASLFEYANVLLDDDDNLTRVGNLTGAAKARLHARALELLGVDAELDA